MKKIFWIFLVTIIIFGVWWIKKDKSLPVVNEPVTNTTIVSDNCIKSDAYVAIAKNHVDQVGSDIVVKYRQNGMNLSCEYSIESGDFLISSKEPDYLFNLYKDLLLIDRGTAPSPRGIIVYDLKKRQIVFTDTYNSPINVENGFVTYWKEIAEKATKEVCVDTPEYFDYGMYVATLISLDLSTMKVVDTGKHQCKYHQ